MGFTYPYHGETHEVLLDQNFRPKDDRPSAIKDRDEDKKGTTIEAIPSVGRSRRFTAAFDEAPPWNTMLAGPLIATIPSATTCLAFQRCFVQDLAASVSKG